LEDIDSDYGLVSRISPRKIYEPLVIDIFAKTFTFTATPSEVADTYRMVYYIGAPNISTTTDDANLLVQPEYHYTVIVAAMLKLAYNDVYGDKANDEILRPIVEPYWDFLSNTMDSGNRSDYDNEGQPL
jgi:hypothetical protein